MDLAGLAALLAIPAGLVATGGALWRERSLFRRWERIEKVIREGSLHGAELAMMENARDHIAERLAATELRPRHFELAASGTVLVALGLGIVVWTLVDPTWKADPNSGWTRIIAWGIYALGMGLFSLRSVLRTNWLGKNREKNYRRTSIFL